MPSTSGPGLATASALAHDVKTLAIEVAPSGVTANSLLPGRSATARAEQVDTAPRSAPAVHADAPVLGVPHDVAARDPDE